MVFELPELPYEFGALEPYIDAKTMEIHHDKHHGTYVQKLNNALEKYPKLQNKDIKELLENNLKIVPDDIKMAVRNNGGGHYNHSLFWEMLKKDVRFKGEVAKAINKKFGSFDKFKEEFSKMALSIFGSGWTWLVVNSEGELEIVKTANQDSPLSEGKNPILGIDMWEHSFYLKHGPNKQAYLEDFFKAINWDKVDELYERAI